MMMFWIFAMMMVMTSAEMSFEPSLFCDGCPTTDTRTQIQNMNVAPYSSIGLLLTNIGNNSEIQCTASLIWPYAILTARHCVNNSSSDIRFYHENNGKLGSYVKITSVKYLDDYVNDSMSADSLNYDFALGFLEVSMPDWLDLQIEEGFGETTYNISTAGYPGSKPQFTAWTVECDNVYFDFNGSEISECANCVNMVKHDCISSDGQSGAPLWDKTTLKIHGIITGSLSTNEGTVYNVGTKMNAFVFDTINNWINSTTLPVATSSSNISFKTKTWYKNIFFYIGAVVVLIVVIIMLCLIFR